MKPIEARKILENYLAIHPMPIYDAVVYNRISYYEDNTITIDESFSFRELLKCAYELDELPENNSNK